MWKRPLFFLAMAAVIVLGGRIGGPSDLYDQDQPKTVAYTVDIARNGRWVLPRDMEGRYATKPPLFNWIGAPFASMGWTSELGLKIPTVLAGVAVVLAIVWAGKRQGGGGWGLGRDVGTVAGVLWLANYAGVKLIYTARPDMVVVACLMGAWCCATVLLREFGLRDAERGGNERRGNWRPIFAWQLWLWVFAGFAALAKGLPALLVVLYVVVGAKLIAGRWSAVWRTGIAWGLPLALGMVGLWLWQVYQIDAEHFRRTFMGAELTQRIAGDEGGAIRTILAEFWVMPAYFLARFAPISVFVLLWWLHVPPREWFKHTTGPATLWVLLTVGMFSLSAGKRADYLAPAYPAAALLAAWWLVEVGAKYRVTPVRAAAGGAVVALGFVLYDAAFSPAARSNLGENVRAFAHQVEGKVGDDPLVFIDTGYNPLQSLLGRNQAAKRPMDEQLAEARWVIKPYEEGDPDAALVSEMIPEVEHREARRLGLYRSVNE